ncbi:DUF6368 family protein [Inquilinus ginsengisoli]|uniref:DUF6368 family protein n=1 Tax=Inquilinus ginsengisoli TaxID=363840 RepID=UPI003D1A0C3D
MSIPHGRRSSWLPARYLIGLPGKVIAIPYELGNGRVWGRHVGDTTFLRAWLGHPDFHMIK